LGLAAKISEGGSDIAFYVGDPCGIHAITTETVSLLGAGAALPQIEEIRSHLKQFIRHPL